MTEEQSTATLPPETFEDADLKLTVERRPGCLVEMQVTVFPALSMRAYELAAQEVAEEVTIPGYRKGKAPPDVVKKNYAKEIEKQWRRALGRLAGARAIELSKIAPCDPTQPVQFSIKSGSPQEGGTLTLGYEAAPTPPSLDISSLQIPTCVITPEIETKARARTLENLLLFASDWDSVTDRPVQEGDFVDLDIEARKEPPEPLYQERRFHVSDEMPSWLRTLVIGKQVGESMEADTQLDERAPPSARAGFTSVPVKITVRAIHIPRKPEVTEEFATKLGLKSLEHLNEVVDTQTQEMLLGMRQREREITLRQQLGERLKNFEVPKTLVEKELRFQINHWMARLSEEQRKALTQEIVQAEANRKIPEAYHLVQMLLLGQQLLAEKAIQLTDAELNALFQQVLSDHVRVHGEPKKENVEELLQHLRGVTMSHALLRATVQYLLDHGHPVEQPHPFV